MARVVTSFLVGMLFGLGLAVSEMTNPARIVGFLDVTGSWDPTLILVMAGALLVTGSLFPLILRQSRPFLADRFSMPIKTKIDWPLVVGAIIFGIGWGLGGFCPGPALAALASGSLSVLLFVVAMLAGLWLASRLESN
jgi:uncharacterized protein